MKNNSLSTYKDNDSIYLAQITLNGVSGNWLTIQIKFEPYHVTWLLKIAL